MRVLIISPHGDDEVLGCGGMIRRRVAEGHTVNVVVAAVSTVHQAGEILKATAETRTQEMEEAARRLGTAPPEILFTGKENQLDTVPMLDIITALDRILTEGRYDQVYVPYPSLHQDHRVIYDASFSALREKGSEHSPSLIAMYEYPYIAWTPGDVKGGRCYVDITDQIDDKIRALEAYESQMPRGPMRPRRAPHPVSPDAVRTLAAMRGLECGRKYAELYYLLKMVD
jgi:LmbE family N-acetylglucosaminyl deacetylase